MLHNSCYSHAEYHLTVNRMRFVLNPARGSGRLTALNIHRRTRRRPCPIGTRGAGRRWSLRATRSTAAASSSPHLPILALESHALRGLLRCGVGLGRNGSSIASSQTLLSIARPYHSHSQPNRPDCPRLQPRVGYSRLSGGPFGASAPSAATMCRHDDELRDELVRDLGCRRNELVVIPKCIELQAYRGAGLAARERAILHAGTWPTKTPEPLSGIRCARRSVSDALRNRRRHDPRGGGCSPDRIRGRVILLGRADGLTVRKLHSQVRVAASTRYAIPVAWQPLWRRLRPGPPIVGSSRLSRDVAGGWR